MQTSTINIDLTDVRQVRAAKAFFDSLLDIENNNLVKTPPTQLELPLEEKKLEEVVKTPIKQKRTRRTKEQIAADKEAASLKVDEQAKEIDQEQSEYTITEVRVALSEKVQDHRTEIKKKLTELGAKNVTAMDPSKYCEFMEFLNGLEDA